MGIILLSGAYAALQSAAAACGPVGLAVGGVVLAGAALIPFV